MNKRSASKLISRSLRALVWGLSVAGVLGGAAFLLEMPLIWLALSALPIRLEPSAVVSPPEPIPFVMIVWLALREIGGYLLFGLLLGGIIGFNAPASEPQNLVESRFFRSVVTHTLQWGTSCWLVLALIAHIICGIFISTATAYITVSLEFMLGLALPAFGLSLWLALRREAGFKNARRSPR